MSEAAEIIARIIDPHSFAPDTSGDSIVADIVNQSRDAAIRKALLVISAVEELAWSEIKTAPKYGDYLVYQPETKSGRSILRERVVDVSQAGHSRPSTHWRPRPPSPASSKARQEILDPYRLNRQSPTNPPALSE